MTLLTRPRRVLAPLTFAALLIVAALACRPVRAQTVYGAGGLFVHPSALVPERGGLVLNASWFSQTIPAKQTEWIPVSLTATLAGRAQIGALHVERRTAIGYRTSNGAFGKYQITPDTDTRPALAIAGSYVNGDVDQSSLSAVLSHGFPAGGRTVATAHLGMQWVRRADIPSPEQDTAYYLGIEVPIARAWRLIGESGTKLTFDRKAASAYGVMWATGGGGSVGVGLVNAGRSDRNRFFVGVGYPIGGGR